MSDSFIIRTGDTVVCIDADNHFPDHYLCARVKDHLTLGATYQVTNVIWLYGEKGLHLENMDHRPTDGWRASRFRKVQPAKKETAIDRRAEAPSGTRV